MGVSSSLFQGIQRIMCVVSYHIVVRPIGSSALASVLLSVVTSFLAGGVGSVYLQAAPDLNVAAIRLLAIMLGRTSTTGFACVVCLTQAHDSGFQQSLYNQFLNERVDLLLLSRLLTTPSITGVSDAN